MNVVRIPSVAEWDDFQIDDDKVMFMKNGHEVCSVLIEIMIKFCEGKEIPK